MEGVKQWNESWIPMWCDECKMHHRPTELCTSGKSKSIGWCNHMDTLGFEPTFHGKEFEYCPMCAKPRPKDRVLMDKIDHLFKWYFKEESLPFGWDRLRDKIVDAAEDHYKAGGP